MIRKCVVCEELTSEPEACDNCSNPMCPACHEEHHGTCSEDCFNEQQYWERVDYEYDRARDR